MISRYDEDITIRFLAACNLRQGLRTFNPFPFSGTNLNRQPGCFVIGDWILQDRIGEVAGWIWDFLENEGESSVTGIVDSVDASRSKVFMAIGWLAREDKLDFVDEGRGSKVRLK